MVNNTITLNFEIEKGKPINQYYFSARIKLTDESKNLLREKLGNAVEFNNLDSLLDLNPENFYIYYNQYAYRDELYVRDDNSRSLTSNLPLNHYGFSMELSLGEGAIADYGFYPLAVIYNPSHYDKAKEKVFDDHGKLLPVASSMLDNFLSNKNNLSTQDVLQNVSLHLQKEAAEEIERLEKEREEERQREEELNKKNEELKELIENGEIKVFKVIRGHDIGNGRSAAVLRLDQREGNEITLDTSKYYIGKDEDGEYLASHLDHVDIYYYDNLFFVLNQSSHSGFESGFYSADSIDPHNYAKYSKELYLRGDQLSEKLSNELKEGNNQVGAKFTINNEQRDEEAVLENETKPRIKRATEENDNGEIVSNSVNTYTKSEGKKITAVGPQENSVLQETKQKLSSNSDEDLNLNAKDSMGYTALHKAVFSRSFDEVKLLIDKGARVDVQDKHELTPLFYAVMNNDEKMTKFLVEMGNADVNLGKYNNPLGIAISRGYMELAEYLIEKGANLDQQNTIGRTLLHKAAEDGNLATVKFLVEKGARLDVLDEWNDTPLHIAANVKANKGHIEVVDYLIKNGADINLTHNYTPIHLAITRGNLDMVKCLIDNGADLFVKRACDGTPLAYAKQQGQMEIVNYMDSVMSNLSSSKTVSFGETNINIKYDLAGNKLNMIEESIKDAVQNFKGAFNTSDHDIEINTYIFNTQDDFKEYLKKVGFDAGNGVNGYTKMIDLSKGNAADIYIYLDNQGNLNQHTLEHEIGHAMHFANLGLSYILPKAMHEAIANYVAGLENGRHINDHGDKEALITIKNKELKPDEILRSDYQGKYYYSEAEQVVKFLEHKHPDLIDNLLKSLATYGYNDRSQGNKLIEDFLTKLKGYDQEFKQWVKVQLSGEEHLKREHEVSSTQEDKTEHPTNEERKRSKRSLEEDEDKQEEVVITSVIDSMKDDKEEDDPKHPLKVKIGEPIETGKYKVELQVTYDDVKNFYDIVRNKYHESKEYTYEQVMVLYNEIVRPANNHHYESFTLDKAYVAGDHLFIKGQDFGTLDDFNEMFYKSDELV